jgi:hypothetical protein
MLTLDMKGSQNGKMATYPIEVSTRFTETVEDDEEE